jgi:hypothetical protein
MESFLTNFVLIKVSKKCLYDLTNMVFTKFDYWSKKRSEFYADTIHSEPEFVNFLKSPGIDSHPCGGPLRQPYLTDWPAWLHRRVESIPWNRFLGSLNIHKYGRGVFFHLNV